MNYNFQKYSEIVEKLSENVCFFNKFGLSHSRIKLFLSNGSVLNICFLKNCIAHLLGINVSYLKGTGFVKMDMNSWDCLEYFLNNSYQFWKLNKEGRFDLEQFFSKNIDEKLDCFVENVHIQLKEIVTVVQYDSERNYQSEPLSDVSDYFIIRQLKNNYYVLGLIRDENNPFVYLPTSSRFYSDFGEFQKFMQKICCKQELTYSNRILITNFSKNLNCSVYLNSEERISRADRLHKMGSSYGASVSVCNDFLFLGNQLITERKLKSFNINVLKLLIDSIKKKNILDYDFAQLDENGFICEEVKDLILAYNDFILCQGSSDVEIGTYSELTSKYYQLSDEYSLLKKQYDELQKQNETLQQLNCELQDNASYYQEQVSIYEEAHQRAKSLIRIPTKNDEQS